jgi:hypothetical protein
MVATLRALANQLQPMSLNTETAHSLQFALYRFDQAVAELDHLTASSAHQMMMMTRGIRAPLVPVKTVVELDLVEDPYTREQLQTAIHSHQADARFTRPNRVVSLLSSEMLSAIGAEELEHRPALRRQLEPAFTELSESVIEAVSLHLSPSQP